MVADQQDGQGRLSRLIFVGVVAVVFVVLSFGTAAAQDTTVTGCKTIDSPGTYVLEGDVGGDLESCIEITSSGVTLDGQGNRVVGGDVENSTGISVGGGLEGVTDVTVTDVEVANWSEGILLSGVEGSTVTGVEVTGSESGAVTLADSSDNVVENSRLADNFDGITAIGVLGEASDNVVRNNVIEDNEGEGILFFFNVNGSTVENNQIRNNNGSGFVTALGPSNSTFSDNTVADNEVGYLASLTGENGVSGNELSENTVGIATATSFGETFSDNTVRDNDVGMLLSNSTNELTDNEMKRNGVDYIDISGIVEEEEADGLPDAPESADMDMDTASVAIKEEQEDERFLGPNTVENMETGPEGEETVLSFESNNVSVDGVDPSEAPAPPEGQTGTGLYFEATDEIDFEEVEEETGEDIETGTLTDSYLDVDVHYGGADFLGDENELELRKYDEEAGEWSEVPSTVDTEKKAVSANLTEYSTYGVFVPEAAAVEIDRPETVLPDREFEFDVTMRESSVGEVAVESSDFGANLSVVDADGDSIGAQTDTSVEFIDIDEETSTYTLKVNVTGGSEGDTGTITAATGGNIGDSGVDGQVSSTFTLADVSESPADGVSDELWTAITQDDGGDGLSLADLGNAIQQYQKNPSDADVGGVSIDLSDLGSLIQHYRTEVV